MSKKPKIYSISPSRGPPGTSVTINGENFGSSVQDILGVFICRLDCSISMKWISPSRITVITRKGCKNKGDVKILTSFGESQENIEFSGFMPIIKPMTEIGCWVEENITLIDEEKIEEVQNNDIMGIPRTDEERSIESFKIFENSSHDISRPNFSPDLLLIEYYHDQPRESFVKALQNVRLAKISNDEQNYRNFLEMNIIPIFKSLEMFNLMHSAILVDNTCINMKAKLNELIEIANSESSLMFDDKIRKKERIDQLRNANSIFHTYKSLFLLPSNLNKYFSQHSFLDAASLYTATCKSYPDLNNFKMAKNFISNSKKIIESNALKLRNDLLIFPKSFQEHNQIIQFISTIDKNQSIFFLWVDGFVNYMKDHMFGIYKQYVEKDLNSSRSKSEKVLEYNIFREFLFKANSNKNFKSNYDSELLKFDMPPGIKLIKNCIGFIEENFLIFWKMCILNFNNLQTSSSVNEATNNKFIEYGNLIFSRLIMIITSIIQPTGKRSLELYQEIGCKFSDKYHQSNQFWMPLVLKFIDKMMESFHFVEHTMLKTLEDFYISLKALTTLKLVRLTSQLIRNFDATFDIGLLTRKGGNTYSSLVEIYRISVINLAHILSFSFAKTSSNHNIFYSEWKDKLDESFSYLFYSIDFPLSKLYELAESNSTSPSFTLISTNKMIESTYITSCSVALTSYIQVEEYLMENIKDSYIQSGFEDIEIFNFVKNKISESVSRCKSLLVGYCLEKINSLTLNIFESKYEKSSYDLNFAELRFDDSSMRQNFMPLILYIVKIKYIINSMNSGLFSKLIATIISSHVSNITKNSKIRDNLIDSNKKITYFCAVLEFFTYFDAFLFEDPKSEYIMSELKKYIKNLQTTQNYDSSLKNIYLDEMINSPLFSCIFS